MSTARKRKSAPTLPKRDTPPIRPDTNRQAPPSRGFGLATLVAVLGICAYVYYSYFLFETPVVHDQYGGVPFKVVDLPGKGKGAIATRNISQGELIIREKPLFIVPSRITTRGSPGALILSLLAGLTPSQRAAFYNLSYVNLPDDVVPDTPSYHDEVALATFQTNSISAGDGVGIFPRTARLNHGCSAAFNAVYSWRPSEEALVVYALKGIREGEELLTTYTDTKRPREARRQHLQAHYGFTCHCSVCSLPDAASQASDTRLTTMAALYGEFRSWQDGSMSGQHALDIARRIWALGEEEGYWSERGQLAADAAWVAAAHADLEAARAWATLARQWYAYELGPDSEHARGMEEVIAHPDSLRQRMTSTRAAEQVGGPDSGWLA